MQQYGNCNRRRIGIETASTDSFCCYSNTLMSVMTGASARGSYTLCCLSHCSLSVWSCITDCLECWREVCTSGEEFILDGSFENDCCNCVEGSACLVATYNASNSEDCWSTARDSIISQLLVKWVQFLDCVHATA